MVCEGGRYRNVCVVQRCTNTMYILSTYSTMSVFPPPVKQEVSILTLTTSTPSHSLMNKVSLKN